MTEKPKLSSGRKQSELPLPLWESSEEYEKPKVSSKCLRCAGDHMLSKCPRCSCETFPDTLSPGDGKNG
jgi:hypothetical protein